MGRLCFIFFCVNVGENELLYVSSGFHIIFVFQSVAAVDVHVVFSIKPPVMGTYGAYFLRVLNWPNGNSYRMSRLFVVERRWRLASMAYIVRTGFST
jgi:hypothetical protein